MFENRVLRRILGPTRDDVTGCWKKCIFRSFITGRPAHKEIKRSVQGE
jgi:hypothetical protein